MKKLIITEEERKRILGMYLKEQSQQAPQPQTAPQQPQPQSQQVPQPSNKTTQDNNLEVAEKNLNEYAKKLNSANLGNYKGQLQTIVEPLGQLYGELDFLNAQDCRTNKKPGTLASERMEPVKNQVYDLFQRIHMDMKNELMSKNLLNKQQADKFTINQAIEMLYTKYNQQKGFLRNIARGILKSVGGGFVSAQMLNILSDGIRKKFGEQTGGLANSIITDFIGGLMTVTPDTSMEMCVSRTTTVSSEVR